MPASTLLRRSALVVFLAVAFSGAVAHASGVVVPDVLDASATSQDVRVTLTGINSNIAFVQQCWRSDKDAAFDPTRDCSSYNAINPVIVNGGGEGVIAVFNGDDPNLAEWSCGTKGSAGVPNAKVCFIRVAPDAVDNINSDEFFPISWSVNAPPPPSTLPPPTVPGFTTTTTGSGNVPGGGTSSTTTIAILPTTSAPGSETTAAAGTGGVETSTVLTDSTTDSSTAGSEPLASVPTSDDDTDSGDSSSVIWIVVIAAAVAVAGGGLWYQRSRGAAQKDPKG